MRSLVSRIPRPAYPLVVLSLGAAFNSWDTYAFGVLTPEIRHAFHLSLTGVGVILAIAQPAFLLGVLPIAYLGDRRRRTRLIGGGMVVWALSLVVIGLAPTLVVFVVATMVDYLASDAPDHVTRSLLADYFGPAERAVAFFAYDFAALPVQVVATLASGVIGDWVGWRWAFLSVVPLGLLLGALTLRLRDPGRGVVDRAHAGADADLAAVEEEPPGFGETARVLGTYPTLRLLYLAVPFGAAAGVGLGLLYSTYLHDHFGLDASGRGLSLAMLVPFGGLGLVVMGALVQRRIGADQLRSALRVAAVLDGVAALMLVLIASAPDLPVALGVGAIEAFCSGGVASALYAVASLVIPPRMRTVGFAAVALWELPSVLANPIAGALADAYGIRVGIGLMAIPAFVSVVLVWLAADRLVVDVARSRAEAVIRSAVRRQRADGDPVLLSVRDLRVDLGGARILDGIDLAVRDGELVALLGTNGAGKSTLLRAFSGLVTPSGGLVIFDGIELGGADPPKIVGMGLVYAPGAPDLYDGLSVADNMRTGTWRSGADIEEALVLFPSLRTKLDVTVAELSGGERQLVNLAIAALARPRMLLLDELTLGLSGAAADLVLDAVRALHARGITIVVVEQSVDRALALAPRVVYLDRGAVRFDGTAATLRRRPQLLRAAFLGDGARVAPAARPDGTHATLRGEDISVRYGGVTAVDGVELDLAGGEVLALVGPNGAGKSTLLDALAGTAPLTTGRVWLEGQEVTALTPDARARLGLGRSFQDARLWPAMTVADAVATSCERHVTEPGALHAIFGLPEVRADEEALAARVAAVLADFGLGEVADRFVGDLSTGMRRILQLACLVAGESAVMLLDEPAAGVAQREVAGMARLIRATQARTGASMIVVEHDLGLVRSVADRVLVLDQGRVIAEGPPDAVLDDPEVQRAYLGRVVRTPGGARAATRQSRRRDQVAQRVP